MGTFVLDYVIYFAFITICYITRAWELTNSKLINMVYKSIMSFVMYNGIITLIIESYTDIWICSLIQFKNLNWTTSGQKIQNISCILFSTIAAAFPCALFFWYCRSKNDKKAFVAANKVKVISLFNGLWIGKGPTILFKPIFFMLRRILLAVTVVQCKNQLYLQIILTIVSIIASIIINFKLRSYETKLQQILEIHTEVTIMLFLYCVICFSPFVGDVETKYVVGYISCAIFAQNILINLPVIIVTSVKANIRKIKIWYLMRKLKKLIKARRGNLEAQRSNSDSVQEESEQIDDASNQLEENKNENQLVQNQKENVYDAAERRHEPIGINNLGSHIRTDKQRKERSEGEVNPPIDQLLPERKFNPSIDNSAEDQAQRAANSLVLLKKKLFEQKQAINASTQLLVQPNDQTEVFPKDDEQEKHTRIYEQRREMVRQNRELNQLEQKPAWKNYEVLDSSEQNEEALVKAKRHRSLSIRKQRKVNELKHNHQRKKNEALDPSDQNEEVLLKAKRNKSATKRHRSPLVLNKRELSEFKAKCKQETIAKKSKNALHNTQLLSQAQRAEQIHYVNVNDDSGQFNSQHSLKNLNPVKNQVVKIEEEVKQTAGKLQENALNDLEETVQCPNSQNVEREGNSILANHELTSTKPCDKNLPQQLSKSTQNVLKIVNHDDHSQNMSLPVGMKQKLAEYAKSIPHKIIKNTKDMFERGPKIGAYQQPKINQFQQQQSNQLHNLSDQLPTTSERYMIHKRKRKPIISPLDDNPDLEKYGQLKVVSTENLNLGYPEEEEKQMHHVRQQQVFTSRISGEYLDVPCAPSMNAALDEEQKDQRREMDIAEYQREQRERDKSKPFLGDKNPSQRQKRWNQQQ